MFGLSCISILGKTEVIRSCNYILSHISLSDFVWVIFFHFSSSLNVCPKILYHVSTGGLIDLQVTTLEDNSLDFIISLKSLSSNSSNAIFHFKLFNRNYIMQLIESILALAHSEPCVTGIVYTHKHKSSAPV